MKHPQNIVDKVIEYKQEGYKSRAIGKLLGIGKSTVNDIWNRYKAENGIPKQRVLLFDIESAPSLAAVFGRWNQNIQQDAVVKEGGFMLSAAWMFLDEPDNLQSQVLTPNEVKEGNDSAICASLYEAFESADVVVGHNVKRFDLPLFRARLVANGMPPHKKVRVVDTLAIAKTMRFNSNRLGDIAQQLGCETKLDTGGIKLWIAAMQGDLDALYLMRRYNEQDVRVLKDVYMQFRAFDNNPPNLALSQNNQHFACPVCGSANVVKTGNNVYTKVSVFEEVCCKDCGHRSKTRTSLNSTNSRKKLLG